MQEVILPKLSEDTEESLVVLWFVSEGDYVDEGTVLCEVQTEKAVSEIRAEESGTVKKIHVKRGESAKAGTPLAVIDPAGEAPAKTESSASAAGNDAPDASTAESQEAFTRASPRLRRLAKELGVKLEDVKGTGRDGAITEQDIRDESGL
ncbi:MAG TPA: biotin/lipoyl-containing protein [Planococcus sp. (in: firmicutes)]|nr:biotin/lipoyl-containing protein [Planococcus sp. (in: firmicutes)]